MGSTYRFIADPSEVSEVLTWFSSLPYAPEQTRTAYGFILYFREYGSLNYDAEQKIDVKTSPVVTICVPQVRRSLLWTVGEVHFLSTQLRSQFPALHKVNLAFSKWLTALPCVFANKRKDNEFAYYLEGSVQNHEAPVHAFGSGAKALQLGRYFVGQQDNAHVLNTLCKKLRLRGIECTMAEQLIQADAFGGP